jgi:hypothetical protein
VIESVEGGRCTIIYSIRFDSISHSFLNVASRILVDASYDSALS